MKKVIIIGAGAAGLSAARTIKDSGGQVDYLLIEQAAHPGGKMFTEEIDGFRIEAGPDCFISEKPSVLRLTEKLGFADRLLNSNENNKGTFVFSEGKLHKLPDGLLLLVPTKIMPFALSPFISWPGKFRMALDLFIPRKNEDSDETLKSFVKRRLGQEALDKIAEPLIGGIHGGNPETMSLKASFPRFLKMEQDYGSLMIAMLAARRKKPAPPPTAKAAPVSKPRRTYFLSYRNGMGEFSRSVADSLDQDKVLYNKAVTRIETIESGQSAPRYRVHLEGNTQLEADAVILAIPANEAAKIIRNVDSALADKMLEIPMASSANISVAYRRKDLPFSVETFGFVIPGVEKRGINAVTYSSIKWDFRSPDDEYVLIRTFVGGGKNQELARLDDQQMRELVTKEFREILGIKAEPVLFKVHRWINGRPQYTIGHLDRVAAIENMLAGLPGLYAAGASYRGIGVPDCVADGVANAEAALNYLKVSAAPER